MPVQYYCTQRLPSPVQRVQLSPQRLSILCRGLSYDVISCRIYHINRSLIRFNSSFNFLESKRISHKNTTNRLESVFKSLIAQGNKRVNLESQLFENYVNNVFLIHKSQKHADSFPFKITGYCIQRLQILDILLIDYFTITYLPKNINQPNNLVVFVLQ